jgi:opacity protein-like surface antigen
MISRTKRNAIAGTALALACSPFCAQGAGFYVDAGVGFSSIGGFNQQELDAAMTEVGEDTFDSFTLNDSRVDKSDMGFSLALGYQVTQNIAVEAAYLQVGKTSYEADATVADGGNPPADLTMGFNFKTSGPAVSLVGSWPVGERLSLDARAGAYFSKTKATVFASGGGESESESLGSEKDTSLLLGMGATWSLTDRLGLRLGYTRLDKAVAGEGDASTFSLGARLSF